MGLATEGGGTPLPDVITAGGPTGSSTVVPVITYDAKGRITEVTTATVSANKFVICGGVNVQAIGTTARYYSVAGIQSHLNSDTLNIGATFGETGATLTRFSARLGSASVSDGTTVAVEHTGVGSPSTLTFNAADGTGTEKEEAISYTVAATSQLISIRVTGGAGTSGSKSFTWVLEGTLG